MTETVAIIDYGSGNLRSAAKAFERSAKALERAPSIIVTDNASLVAKADRIVLPGVGAFADCKKGLEAVPDMIDTLNHEILQKAKPFFGICVGMQLMAKKGYEHGECEGLGWIDGEVVRITPNDLDLKIPHMGWNTLIEKQPHSLFKNIKLGPEGKHAYFVHSYHMALNSKEYCVAESDYGGRMTACVASGTMFGTQFHPEKSQELGLRLIENFLRWKP
jgi:glutamine amidotransferase